MDIELNLSHYVSIMLNAFRDLLCSKLYAGIINLALHISTEFLCNDK